MKVINKDTYLLLASMVICFTFESHVLAVHMGAKEEDEITTGHLIVGVSVELVELNERFVNVVVQDGKKGLDKMVMEESLVILMVAVE